MINKKVFKLTLYIIVVLTVMYSCFWVIGLFQLDSTPEKWVPENGVWYCDELELQLSFTANDTTYAIIDGKKVICTWIIDRGSPYISVLVQESGVIGYPLGKLIFCGKYVNLNDSELILKDRVTKTQYSFIMID